MNPICEPTSNVMVKVVGIGHVPSFKNHKRAFVTESGKTKTATRKDIKQRMDRLEDAILFALYSECQTTGGETATACRRRLQTLLSGLCDDSLREVPESSFGVKYVAPGEEGVEITITLYEDVGKRHPEDKA